VLVGGGVVVGSVCGAYIKYDSYRSRPGAARIDSMWYATPKPVMDAVAVADAPKFETVPTREDQLARLKENPDFDLLVVGGGATGCGVALDATLRGMRVLLVEREDFGAGTSSRSTKLIHGGVRYLEKAFFQRDPAQLKLVFEALRERAIMLYQAPHLTGALPTLLPCYALWEIPFYWAGLKAYDILAWLGSGLLFASHFVSSDKAARLFPTLASASATNASATAASKRTRNTSTRELQGAIVYYDGQMDDARFALALAITAAQHGAVVLNHADLVALHHSEKMDSRPVRIEGASIRLADAGGFDAPQPISAFELEKGSKDAGSAANEQSPRTVDGELLTNEREPRNEQLSQQKHTKEDGELVEVRVKAVVNATGPFCDAVRALDEGAGRARDAPMVVGSAGVHVVLPEYYSPDGLGLIVPKTKDGRVVFVLPWLGATLAGTTDSSSAITHAPRPTEKEVGFILDALSDYLAIDVRRSDVLSAWSGIRPLAMQPTPPSKVSPDMGGKEISGSTQEGDAKVAKSSGGGGTQNILREHLVYVSESGLVNISGGKWTTYRLMAEHAVDAVVEQLGLDKRTFAPCVTQHVRLVGAHDWDTRVHAFLVQEYGISLALAKHLSRAYGDQSWRIAQRIAADSTQATPLAQGHLVVEAEVQYAVQHEMSATAVDFLARRTRLAFLDSAAARHALPRIVDIMAAELEWSDSRKTAEIQRGLEFLSAFSVMEGE